MNSFVLYEVDQHSEDLCNSVNEYFLNKKCVMLLKYSWVKYLFKVSSRLMDFNVTKYVKFIIMVSDSTLQPKYYHLPSLG